MRKKTAEQQIFGEKQFGKISANPKHVGNLARRGDHRFINSIDRIAAMLQPNKGS